MNAQSILNNLISFVSLKMHKKRQNAVIACVQSLLKGSSTSVTSMGRGIANSAYEKHRIKRADRLLSNDNLHYEAPFIYASICKIFCTSAQPVIAVDGSDLDAYQRHFLLRAALTVKGRAITLYQEVHTKQTKEKPATHKAFLDNLYRMIPKHSKPIIVTDAGYKSPWFRQVRALGWDIVGRIRKPHFYSLNEGNTWQSIAHLYAQATHRPKLFEHAHISRHQPFQCTLTLIKHKEKGRHAFNTNGRRKCSGHSLSHAKSAKDPWLLATSLPAHRNLAKQVVSIYRQRMQIEESFRDMKSRQFGLGLEHNRSFKCKRLAILILLSTLASLVAFLMGMAVNVANIHRRFQANTSSFQVLSFHTLGLRALATGVKITRRQWSQTLIWLEKLIKEACHAEAWH
ncbi:Transposase DDE domain-containing protein [Idiomarinaceae bacterium HL-53]|nr:Transposase DDE domain-containing protein [Idiomarinaceae bacterium HL-53]CUS47840.1 Transposase DDE domain-containing protein [Idiomarinaceae bacterium HL-53]